MPLTITPATLATGLPGVAYGQALAASGGSPPYTFRLSGGALPPGLNLTGSSGQFAGCTINYSPGGSVLNIKNGITRWSGLVYPIAAMKVYAPTGVFPTPAKLPDAPNDVQAAVALGIPFYMCYHPSFSGSYNDPSWTGGANKPTPAQIAADQAAMINSVQALTAVGAKIVGVVMWQEGNSNKNALTADQYTYLHYRNYAALKSALGLPVISVYAAYQLGNANIADYFPGPTVLDPGATLYTDGVGADWYHEGYQNGCYLYSKTPTTVPGYFDLADYAAAATGRLIPAGVTEAGNSASGNTPPPSKVIPYLSSDPVTDPTTGSPVAGDPVRSCQAVYAWRIANNLPLLPFMWYENDGASPPGPNVILDPADFRLSPLRAISAAQALLVNPQVAGTPTAAGKWTFTVTAADSLGATATATRSITIGAPPLVITTTAVPPGIAGQPYLVPLAATGGTPFTT